MAPRRPGIPGVDPFTLKDAPDPISQILRASLDRKKQRRFERGVAAGGGAGLPALIGGISNLVGGVSSDDPVVLGITSSLGLTTRTPTTRRLPGRIRKEIKAAVRAGAMRAIATDAAIDAGLPGFVSRRGEPVLVDPFTGLEFFVSERQDPLAAFRAFNLDLPPGDAPGSRGNLTLEQQRERIVRDPLPLSRAPGSVTLSPEQLQIRRDFPQEVFRGLPQFEEQIG